MSNIVEFQPRANDVVTEFVSQLLNIQKREIGALHLLQVLDLALAGYKRGFGDAKYIDKLEIELAIAKENSSDGAA